MSASQSRWLPIKVLYNAFIAFIFVNQLTLRRKNSKCLYVFFLQISIIWSWNFNSAQNELLNLIISGNSLQCYRVYFIIISNRIMIPSKRNVTYVEVLNCNLFGSLHDTTLFMSFCNSSQSTALQIGRNSFR